MSYGFLDIAATPSVRAVQAAMGSDRIFENFKGHREFDRFTQMYTVEKTKIEARKRGHSVHERQLQDGSILVQIQVEA